ncbi:MAG TPA: glycine cleavage T C-terminal barrel domain-containing protein [Longimicrobiales bacterium]|nr:glycine cleavage T C-terminal barrel domain-containing protein [Longimicrobiales bacterium]
MSVPLAGHESLGVRWSSTDEATRLPRNYGDAAAEYRAAREHAIVVDRCDRGVLRMHGRDPLRILQGIVTNDVAGAADRAVYAALLTPKGRMLTELRIVRARGESGSGDVFLLELPALAIDAVLASFRRTVPPLYARYADASAELHVLGVYGPAARAALAPALTGTLPPAHEDALAHVAFEETPGHVIGTRYAGVDGYDVLLPRASAERLWTVLRDGDVRPAGHAALDVLRIEAGSPKWGAELTEETIPLEAGLRDRAISTGKGCYTGQEVIIRILHRGHVNWQLRGLLLGESPGVAPGTPLQHPETGRPLARITSVAWSPRHDQEIALGYVRREVAPPTLLELGTGRGRARVVALPFEPADVPAQH